jgi:pimeloyl-ACP methyl ester carboxylesterase
MKPSSAVTDLIADKWITARDRLWNLGKQPFGLNHQFLKLRSGFQFHYITNDVPNTRTIARPDRPLVILLHGFPDSWAIWRHILKSTALCESTSVVTVDLPGYGGTDRLKTYSATQVLENLTEFIIAIRELYGVDGLENGQSPGRVIIVGHDWGCVLSTRLAAEAPELADRFILTNGPIVSSLPTP